MWVGIDGAAMALKGAWEASHVALCGWACMDGNEEDQAGPGIRSMAIEKPTGSSAFNRIDRS